MSQTARENEILIVEDSATQAEQLKYLLEKAVETPEQIKAHIENILFVLRDDFETRHRSKGGDIINVMTTAQVIENHGRPFINFIFHDITERKKGDAALQNAKIIAEAANRAKSDASFCL